MTQFYQPGDPPPKGYLQWHRWAEEQYKQGLRQDKCGKCGLWKFPQELSGNYINVEVSSESVNGLTNFVLPHVLRLPVCLVCEEEGDG